MLYEPERHEALRVAPWDEERARTTIGAIAADAASRFDAQALWPIHPLDHTDMTDVPSYKGLYVGAAGVIWALRYLAEEEVIESARDWNAELAQVHRAYLEAPESVVVMPSYLLGESGILLVSWRLRAASEIADRLNGVIQDNVSHPSNEIMLGTPGTMLAALWMHEWTGEERWRSRFVEGAEQVWSAWTYEPAHACWLWTQQMFGQSAMHIGAVHGFTGNTYSLLRGAHLLSDERRNELLRRCVETLRRTAVTDPDGANWPQSVGEPRSGRTAWLLQWCNGAPGVIGMLRYLPHAQDAELDAVLERGAELIWKAGPLTKGPGLCHGTAGNGYAFLEMFRRTRNIVWLDRARTFAMHAVGQYEQMREQYGCGRYSLWTGDPGVAVYLWHCIRGEGGFPTMDML